MGTYYNVDKTSNLDTYGYVLQNWVSNHNTATLINVKDDFASLISLREVFAYHPNLQIINLTGLRTELVNTMFATFYEDVNLRTLTMNNYLYNINIAGSVCANCRNLTSFPNFLYSYNLNDLSYGFKNCFQLPNVNTTYIGQINKYCNNIQNMDSTFSNCPNLTNLLLTSWNAPKLFAIRNLCYGDSNLKTVNLSGGNFINLKYANNAFTYCNSLTTVNLANCNFNAPTNVTNIFYGCSNLTNVQMPNMVIQNAYYMFYNCYNLLSANLTGWNTNVNNSTLAYMFYNCQNLNNLTISSDFLQVTNCKNTSRMFSNCINLASFPSTLMNGTADSSYMFYNCHKLSGGVANYGTAYLQNASGLFYNTNIWSYSGGYGDNTTDTSYMFAYCHNLLTANIYYWTPTKLTSTSSMFRDCFNLYNVNMSKFACANTYNLSYMFASCNNLSTLLTDNVYFNGALYINHMFYNCQKLTGPNILSNTIFANVMYAQYMFYNCRNLTNLNSGKWNMCNAMYLNSMFYNCQNLQTINFTGWNLANAVNIAQMFYRCNNLTTSTLDSFFNLLLSANNVTYKNLSNSNTYSPFYGTNYSFAISMDFTLRGWSI